MAEGSTNAQNAGENETGAVNIGCFLMPTTISSTSYGGYNGAYRNYPTKVSKSIKDSIEIYNISYDSELFNLSGTIRILSTGALNRILRGTCMAMHGYPSGNYKIHGCLGASYRQRIFNNISVSISSNGIATATLFSNNEITYISDKISDTDAICAVYITDYEVA